MTSKNKINKKEYDNNVIKFINELREQGVKDSTIELIFRDIQEYQEEQINKMLKEMRERMIEVLRGDE